MKVKQRLITLFENNRGRFVSGEELADQLGCSRAAVWKAVHALRSEGYRISAVTNKGYRLENETDVLSEAGIRKYLDTDIPVTLLVYKSINSTNTVLREFADQGAAEFTVAVAGNQTGGKGRLGRSFFSPPDTGLYLSILLRPKMSAAESVKITTAAAVAVARAVSEAAGKQAQIKWVNDICLDGKKVCGILTEASFALENGGLDNAVVGIGVNAYEPEGGFPDELKSIAGAVMSTKREDMRNRIAASIISGFSRLYADLSSAEMLEEYRSRLMWVGEKIRVISGQDEYLCRLLGIDSSYSLKVRLPDGSERRVSSGEISIRRALK